MLNNFIYSTPTWLWGAILVLVFVTMATVGLIIFNAVVQIEVRKSHNDVTGFTIAIIAVTYAVLLAFIAVATWESYSRAGDIVDREASFVGNIYRDTVGLPGDVGRDIRADLQEYVRIVIEQEWPTQRKGEVPDAAWTPLYRTHAAIVTLHPQNLGESVIEAELLRTLNDLYGRARQPDFGDGRTYSRCGLVDHPARRHDHDGLHVSLRLPQLPDASGDDRGRLGLTRARRRADHGARLAVPRRSQHRARRVREHPALVV